MSYSNLIKTLTTGFATILLAGAPAAAYRCLPSCDATDGRMVGTTADGFANTVDFGGTLMDVQIVLPNDATSLEVGIFDGDDLGANRGGLWDADFDAEPALLRYQLCEDANADLVCDTVLADMLSSDAALAVSDNAWFDFPGIDPQTGGAQAASGFFFYLLHIEVATTEPGSARWNMFKLRVNDEATMYVPTGPAIGFGVPVISMGEYEIVTPGGFDQASLDSSNYDGTFSFVTQLDPDVEGGSTAERLEIWDGDFDFGGNPDGGPVASTEGDQVCYFGGATAALDVLFDRNDADTLAGEFPQFVADAGGAAAAGVSAESGGGAAGFDGDGNPIVCYTLGSPPDDWSNDDPSQDFGVFKRAPQSFGRNIVYTVSGAGGSFQNANPSGNREYEQFSVSGAPGCDPAEADHCVGSALPAGLYDVVVEGMDVLNLSHIIMPICVAGPGQTCPRDTECSECSGKISQLELAYLGSAAANVRVEDRDDNAVFDGTVAPGEHFAFSHHPSETDFGTEISIYVGGALHIKIHTSCSQPVGPGLVFGDFRVAMGRSRDGGALCPLEACAPLSADFEFKDREAKWDITNNGDADLTIERITVSWPAANGELDEVKRDGDTIHKGNFAPTSAVIDSGWEGNADKRTIEAGKTDTLKLKFKNDAVTDQTVYSITVEFGSGCVLEFVPNPGGGGTFDCDKPIDQLVMVWDGTQDVRIKAWKGSVGSTLLADVDNITTGGVPGTASEVSVSGFAGSPNDVYWEVFAAGTATKLGESKFHLSCSDDEMDGAEDCGNREGNGKANDAGFINDWLLEGMTDQSGTFDCTP